MTRELHKVGIFEDLGISEALFFVRVFLGGGDSVQDIVEEALCASFSCDEPPSQAQFFQILEELLLKKRKDGISANAGQLELFSSDNEGNLDANIEKEIRIARAQAYLFSEVKNPGLVEPEDSLVGNEKFRELVVEFSGRLREEESFGKGTDHPGMEVGFQMQISSYLLGFLSENDAMEVERKCRQHPGWQSEKVWIGKVISWMEQAVQKSEANLKFHGLEFDENRKKQILKKINILPERNEDNSPGNQVLEKNNPALSVSTIKTSPRKKDRTIHGLLLVGLFASLIGYVGWQEHLQKVKDVHLETKKVRDIPTKTVDSWEDDNWSHVAMRAAQQSASQVLGEKLVKKIDRMKDEIKVPSSLLPRERTEAKMLELPKGEVLISPSSMKIQIPSNEKLMEALSLSEGFVFLPDEEALGRVIDLNRTGSSFTFCRADWLNPEKSFALAVSDYELRMGAPLNGFVILLGEVKRVQDGRGIKDDRPRYHLSARQAWWLDENQSRIEMDISLLEMD